jgi:hypothetical protein
MKNSIKLTTYLHAVIIYIILFYSTSLFAETFKKTFDVNLGGQLTVKTDTGSIKIPPLMKPQYNFKLKLIIEKVMNFLIATNSLMATYY